jgi:hypothetical protein
MLRILSDASHRPIFIPFNHIVYHIYLYIYIYRRTVCGGEVCHDGVHLSPHLRRLVPIRPEERHTRTTTRCISHEHREGRRGEVRGAREGNQGLRRMGDFWESREVRRGLWHREGSISVSE